MPSYSYSVSLGDVARTLRYEDALGTILFSFDVGTANGGTFLILERPLGRLNELKAVNDGRKRAAQIERVSAAFDRTREHLIQQGHQVKIWPDEFQTSPKHKTR